jgi:Flp pilus assembly protein TadG
MYLRQRKKSGSGIIETAAGLILLIPVLLILIDIAAVVLAQTANDALAKQCARAAADLPSTAPSTNPQMISAATNSYNNYSNSSVVTKGAAGNTLTVVDNGDGTVTVRTWITCTLPVPVPFGGPASTGFEAFSTEPIVGQLPGQSP